MVWGRWQQTAVIAVEITDSAIQLMALRRHWHSLALDVACVVPLPEHQDREADSAFSGEEVAAAIRECIQRYRLKAKALALAIDAAELKQVVLNIDSADLATDAVELSQQLQMELDNHVMDAADGGYFDFVVPSEASGETVEITVRYVPKSVMSVYETICENSGLHLEKCVLRDEALSVVNADDPLVAFERRKSRILQGDQQQYGVCAGLLLLQKPQWNFTPWRQYGRARRKKYFIQLLVLSMILAGLVVAGVAFFSYQEYQTLKQQQQALQQQSQALLWKMGRLTKLKKQRQQLLQQVAEINALQAARKQDVQLLQLLVQQLPQGVVLTALERLGQQITLKGQAQANADVSELMRRLEKTSLILSPRLERIKAISGPGPGNQFIVKAQLAPLDIGKEAP